MAKLIKKLSAASGMAPGTIVHIGEERSEKIKITVFTYNEAEYSLKEFSSVDEVASVGDGDNVTWINIDGVHDTQLVEKLGKKFNIHPLALEDVVNTGQRPKYEDFGDYLFVVMKMLYHSRVNNGITSEQVSLIVGHNYVISFQEIEGDVFDSIRERIKTAKGRIRKMGSDYLAYTLLDAVVDNYFVILENLGEKIEDMEERIIKCPEPKTLQTIHRLKRNLIYLRKSVWPLRELINGLQKGESGIVKKTTEVYLRDLYDHTIQVIDTVETFRDMVSGMLDIYLSSLSNKMNEVMKVLTIFAAIFIPLTFIAGVYGMNFKYMPELNWRWGYFAVLGFMALVGIVLLGYFKRKKWF
jgi:magnesium transporter